MHDLHPHNDIITEYYQKFYSSGGGHCTLCGNTGEIDTRGLKTPAGLIVGRINFCICPNGQSLRAFEMKTIKVDEKFSIEGNELFITISSRLNPAHFIQVSYGMELHNLVSTLMHLSNSMEYGLLNNLPEDLDSMEIPQ